MISVFNRDSSPAKIIKRSPLINIYHCCTHKSGSQWIKKIFADDIVFAYSGLKQYSYSHYLPDNIDRRKITERYFDSPFPEYKIISPLYITYDSYKKIPKSIPYKAIFILRDPRDLVVSYYFSMSFSHAANPEIIKTRARLNKINFTDGLIFCINWLGDFGTYSAQRSWAEASDETVLIVKYEDLIGLDSKNYFKKIFEHCEIDLPERKLTILVKKYSFEKMSKGRKPGQENQKHHYRKGISRDWKNYFTEEAKDRFKKETGELLIALDYEKDINW